MNIGLTYDLRSEYLAMGFGELETAEFDRDDTIVAIESALQALGQNTDRIGNAFQLTERLVQGDRWDLVFNIAEGLNGMGREAQVPAILDLYGIPYTFSDPLIMSLTLHKGLTKQVLKDHECATAEFVIMNEMDDLAKVSFPPPYFVKPVAEGTGKGITPLSIVRDRRRLKKACQELLFKFKQPVLIERYLSGREFTTAILGTGSESEVLGTMEVFLLDNAEKGVYSYSNKENSEECVEYKLVNGDDPTVRETEALALKAWKALGCRDGGRIDLRCDEAGKPYFLEVNPLAGLHPHHSDLPIICKMIDVPYVQLINRIFSSASARVVEGKNTMRWMKKCV
ncbi:ATP-grasp domain-containing protein [bacterium]|nr:ATP-grasp domain-containing protein [bacterium]